MLVKLVGLGCGTIETMTGEAADALNEAELLIGASRLLESVSSQYTQNRIAAVDSGKIFSEIQMSGKEKICVLYSGDTGFYSGTRRLLPLLQEAGIDFHVVPGISSVQLFSARLGLPWQDWNLCSAHGMDCNAVGAVMQGKPSFFLTGGQLGPRELCIQLKEAGLGYLKVAVGENLGCETERIYHCTAGEAAERDFASLSVLWAEALPDHVKTEQCRTPGIPDDKFIRGKVPMTKQDVRTAVLGKLAVRPDDVIWDVGAGTGSVSVELALAARQGYVYAVECMEEGCSLIAANRRKFGAWNLYLKEGKAPEALEGLPVPDAVFIGGTKGHMMEIISLVHEKNPDARICISAIALETLSEAVRALADRGFESQVTQIAVSSTKSAGNLHLLMANNPIFLITKV